MLKLKLVQDCNAIKQHFPWVMENKSPCPRWKSPQISFRPSKRKKHLVDWYGDELQPVFFVVLGDYEIILSSRNSHSTTLDTLSASEFDYENHSCLNYAMQFNQTKLVSWQNFFRWQDTGWTQGIPTENTKGIGISMPIGRLDRYCCTFCQNNITTIPAPRFANSLVVVCVTRSASAEGRSSSWNGTTCSLIMVYITLPINLLLDHSTITNEWNFAKSSALETMMEPCCKKAWLLPRQVIYLAGLASESWILILKFYPSKVVKEDDFQVILVHVYIYIYLLGGSFKAFLF